MRTTVGTAVSPTGPGLGSSRRPGSVPPAAGPGGAGRPGDKGPGEGIGSSRAGRVVSTTLLVVAGLVATAVGAAEMVTPVSFRAGYGIDMAGNVNLFSETRAAGGGLVAVGAVILLGAVVRSLTPAAALLGALTYGGYGLARVLSMAADGRPDDGLVVATAVELALGLACTLLLLRPPLLRRPDPASRGMSAG